ncbi:MAG: hypothetical protein NVSMB45_09270 [Ginsengibacter sp.]
MELITSMTKSFFFFFVILICHSSVFADVSDTNNVPLNRQVFHDRIKAEQVRADRLDGKLDGLIKISNINEINQQVTDALIRKINVLRNNIESNAALPSNNDKIKYLRLVEDVVKGFTNNFKSHKIPAALAPLLIDNFTQIMKANIRGEDMTKYIHNVPYEVGNINAEIFKENAGYPESRKELFIKYVTLHPEKILASIGPYADEAFADSLILTAFRLSPTTVYNYAQASQTVQGRLIRRNPDSRIKTIVELSKLNNALFYFPFLDELITGKQTIENISKYIGNGDKEKDSVGYYKLMVKTEIDYYIRLVHGDTPIAMLGVNGLYDMLQRKAVEHFITPINELHEVANPAVRFKAIEPLNAQELYYLMVLGENDIYTSSYKNTFEKMIVKMGPKPRGDSLLMLVNFDKFKKFLKMAAGYNKLESFLETMPPSTSETLMKGFVSNLESTGTLEDAVDVADSYGSIKSPELLTSMLKNVSANEARCAREKNIRGKHIYNLLKTIFLSADTTNHVDLSKEIGIPPVYTVDFARLANDSGVIVEQIFFYGDKDGKEAFNSYLTSFPARDWKMIKNKQWIEIESIKGKSVHIYANLPLDNVTDKDAEAQKALIDYLESKNLRPTVVMHRGHSYHLQYTIEQLPESAKIIMLGSCGGYNNLKQILDYAPEAHIISTKQIGAKDVNKPIIEALNNTLRAGENIDWRKIWAGLDTQFSKGPKKERDLFDDYIPPHKNLGALFIKAYSMQESK